jgi:hypothetical protein
VRDFTLFLGPDILTSRLIGLPAVVPILPPGRVVTAAGGNRISDDLRHDFQTGCRNTSIREKAPTMRAAVAGIGRSALAAGARVLARAEPPARPRPAWSAGIGLQHVRRPR